MSGEESYRPINECGVIHPRANATNKAINNIKERIIRTDSALTVRFELP